MLQHQEQQCTVGEELCAEQDPNHKHSHGMEQHRGPCTVSKLNDNDTIQLSRVTARGAFSKTWNVHNMSPHMA